MNPPCSECGGKCCCRKGWDFAVLLDQEDVDKIPEAKSYIERCGKHEAYEAKYKLNYVDGRCPFFSSGLCSIYERRPQRCREFNCTNGYKIKDGKYHSFFLDDYPEVVALIEKKMGK